MKSLRERFFDALSAGKSATNVVGQAAGGGLGELLGVDPATARSVTVHYDKQINIEALLREKSQIQADGYAHVAQQLQNSAALQQKANFAALYGGAPGTLAMPAQKTRAYRRPPLLFSCKACGRPVHDLSDRVSQVDAPKDQTHTFCNICLSGLDNMVSVAPELVNARLAAFRLSGGKKIEQQEESEEPGEETLLSELRRAANSHY